MFRTAYSHKPMNGIYVSDFLFVTGMFFLLYGLIMLVYNLGLFDSTIYGARRLLDIILKKKHLGAVESMNAYHEFIENRRKCKTIPFFVAGAVFIAVSMLVPLVF